MADTDIVQVISEARIDARSLSEFVWKPADFMVTRRLAPAINTLNYYLDKFDSVSATANSSIAAANKSISSANALIADANTKILAANGVVANAYAGAEQRFFDTANNNLNSQIDVYLSAQDIGKSVFDTPQAGVDAGIASGGYYSVRSTDSDYFLEEYKNNAGTPQATGKKYPAAKFLLTKGVFTVSELLILGATATAGARFNTHGFYTKGDCLPSVFEVQTVAVGDVFTDIGNGTLIGSDASVKVNATKKLKLIANESVSLSQLGGIKTVQSVTIKNDVIGSVILKNYKRLVIDGFYTLRGTLWHGVNNRIIGIGKSLSGIKQGDNVNLYTIQSINSDIKNEVRLNDYLELAHFEIDGNESKNRSRDYSGDINETYWGFGVALFNIDNLYIHDLHVKDTNAWGISYHLCNKVHGENLTFDQKVEFGLNKDGITGSGKRVIYKNISGYTSDDMCAVGTGTSSLEGFDCGIAVNQDIEYVRVSGVEGAKKEGMGTLYAVGIYGPDNAKIGNVDIDNVKGVFGQGVLRFANYWYVDSKVNFGAINLRNIAPTDVQSSRKNHVFLSRINCKSVTIDGISYKKQGDVTDAQGGNVIQIRDCDIGVFSVLNTTVEQIGSTQNILLFLGKTNNNVLNYYIENVTLITSETIIDDSDSTNGNFRLIEGLSRECNNFTVKNVSPTPFKRLSYIQNLAGISARVKNFSVDVVDYIANDPDLLLPAAGVSITSSKLSFKNSVLHMDIIADITVSDLAVGKLVATWGANMLKIKKENTIYAPKPSSDGANMNFLVAPSGLILLRPDLLSLSTTGTYKVSLKASISTF